MPHRRLLSLAAVAVIALVLAVPAGAATAGSAASIGRYYASFGHEQPIVVPVVHGSASGGPGWALAIVAGVGLVVAGALAGRVSVRPRRLPA
jgi:hypothetical protein